jgi:hypothetical protein
MVRVEQQPTADTPNNSTKANEASAWNEASQKFYQFETLASLARAIPRKS